MMITLKLLNSYLREVDDDSSRDGHGELYKYSQDFC